MKCLENGRPSTPPTPSIFKKKHSNGVLFVHVISLQPSSAPKSPSPTWKSFRYVIHISGEFFSLAENTLDVIIESIRIHFFPGKP